MTAIERDLEQIGRWLAYPETPTDMPPLVHPRAMHGRRVVFAVAAVTLVAVVLVPPAREAVARWLGLGAVSIVEVDDLPPASRATVDGLGVGIPLEAAATRVGVEIPRPEGYGTPDIALLGHLSAGDDVTFAWLEDDRVVLLLSVFDGSVAVPLVEKQIGPDARYSVVAVSGERGIWIEGAHTIAWFDVDGDVVFDEVRLAGNVLLWEMDGRTWRLEGADSLSEAVEIAVGLRSRG